MIKFIRFTLSLILMFLFSLVISSCSSYDDIDSKKKVMINDVGYSSLTDAVKNAKSEDTIKIYRDIKDNKNVLITKPLTIKGMSSNNQTKPKFYGSLTVDLNGETDTLEIENIELIHSGKKESGENNNNTVGINLIDGGLTLKSSIIALENPSEADKDASGLIISRTINSVSTSPISIIGNDFESYLANFEDLSSAIKILSNKANSFKTLILNEEEIINKNNFLTNKLSNQLISLDLSDNNNIYTYYATTSLNDFVKALKENQGTNSTFILYATTDQALTEDIKEILVSEKNMVYIYGNSNLDFNNLTLKLSGHLETETKLNNLKIEKTSSTANFIENIK